MKIKNIKKLAGDASFRKFYRKRNAILITCKTQKKINLVVYDAVNKILNNNNILAPKLISQNYKNNYIEITDFGDQTIFKLLGKSEKKNFSYYNKVLKLLNKIQKIKKISSKTFLNKKYQIPIYTKKKILDEAYIFLDWYLPSAINKSQYLLIKKKIRKNLNTIYEKIKNKKKVFVHRDFHVSNIMKTKKGLALIDTQDAVHGNPAYDLASLIDDVRFKTSTEFKKKIYKSFTKNLKINEKKFFKNDFEILSVLRNLKILGIFVRLFKRDNKKKYLKYIPYTWQLIMNRIEQNAEFNDLKFNLEKYVKKNIRYEN